MNDLEQSLLRTLQEADLSELTADAADKALEAVDGIPVVGFLHKAWKTACAIPTYLFMKKMIRFLCELKDVSPEERRSQLAKLDVVPGEKEKVGEAVLLLLDRLNDMEKAGMMGRAFKAYLLGKISMEQLRSLDYAIDRLDTAGLPTLRQVYHNSFVVGKPDMAITEPHFLKELGYHDLQNLAFAGLLDIHFERIDTAHRYNVSSPSEVSGGFRTNPIGRLFFEHVMLEAIPPQNKVWA